MSGELSVSSNDPHRDGPILSRLKYLNLALQAIKSWTDLHVFFPVTDLRAVSLCTVLQSRHSIGLLLALTTLEDPMWNKAEVRATIDILQLVDTMIERCSLVAPECGLDRGVGDIRGEDMFNQAAERSKKLRAMLALQLQPQTLQQTATPASGVDMSVNVGFTGDGEVRPADAGDLQVLNFEDFDWSIDSFFAL